MRIRPYIVTGAAAAIAGAALAVLMVTHDPYDAEPAVRVLFWIALPLCAWMLASTVLAAMRWSFGCALWCPMPAVAAATGLLAYSRGHEPSRWLLGAVILATLAMTVYLRRLVSSQ